MTSAPYGSWPSPIAAADLASSGHPVEGGRYVGDDVWWSELRPSEGGRVAVRRLGLDDEPEDVLPAPWNARTRVHEYGGGAWTVTDAGRLVFAEFGDQRLYLLEGGTPVPLTPEPPQPCSLRYGDLSVVDGEVWAVRETHDTEGGVARDICVIPLDGSAAEDSHRVRSVVAGSDFLANPRLSPDRRHLAWIAWDHPQMPWDGTELRVVEVEGGRVTGKVRTLLGGPEESVLQPEWVGPTELYTISDRSGWWNLYRVGIDDRRPGRVVPDGRRLRRRAVDARRPLAFPPRRRHAADRQDLRHRHPRRPRSRRPVRSSTSPSTASPASASGTAAATGSCCSPAARRRRRAAGTRPRHRRPPDHPAVRHRPARVGVSPRGPAADVPGRRTRSPRHRLPAASPAVPGRGRGAAAVCGVRARRTDVAGRAVAESRVRVLHQPRHRRRRRELRRVHGIRSRVPQPAAGPVGRRRRRRRGDGGDRPRRGGHGGPRAGSRSRADPPAGGPCSRR